MTVASKRVCLECGATSGPVQGMRWVRQEHPDGCGMATLAMLCDMTYQEVVAEMLADPWLADSEFVRKNGECDTFEPWLQKFLGDHGYYYRNVYSTHQPNGPWPPAPFAAKHYAIVQNPGGLHYVAMDRLGRVLDPLREGWFKLTDWATVRAVIGLEMAR
jgi:hypothetical protein